MKFRKKPVEIEAIKIEVILSKISSAQPAYLPNWVIEALKQHKIEITSNSLVINTLEGLMQGRSTDWLIKGIKDELYPCKDDIFKATYEQVD